MTPDALFLVNLFCSVFMAGLIWFVQLVHYPSFRFVGDIFTAFHQHHTFKTGIIVMPIMTAELITSGWLWSLSTGWVSPDAIGFYLVIAIWVATAAFHVPAHNTLSKGKDLQAIEKLIATNWIRVVLWSLKVGLGGWIGIGL